MCNDDNFVRVSKGICPFGGRGYPRGGIEPPLGQFFSYFSVCTEKYKIIQKFNINMIRLYVYKTKTTFYLTLIKKILSFLITLEI